MAKVRSEAEAEAFKRSLTLHYTGAKLQRAAKIPPLSRLTGEARPASYQAIKAAFSSKRFQPNPKD